MIVARRYLVSGRVQGVGFRFFVQDAARREGLAGSVRNLSDGRVEVEAEGEVAAVARFERALHMGPPGARVDEIHTDILTPKGRPGGFHVQP